MKTKLAHEKGRISLLVDHGKDKSKEKMVLAAMTLFEGTGCWTLIDIRLSERPVAHPWSGSGNGEDFYASHRPETKEEAGFFKSRLREFEELEDGEIRWCTFRDIVRGECEIDGFAPGGYKEFRRPVFHKRAGALSLLKEIQVFWEGFEGSIADSTINNPFRQPRSSNISADLWVEQAVAKKKSRSREASEGLDP